MKKQEYIRPEIEMIEIGTPVMLAEPLAASFIVFP